MNIFLKSVRSSLFTASVMAVGTALFTASAGKAQQPTMGSILSTEKVGENCTLIIQVETVETPIVDVTEVGVCDRILPGDTVQLSYTYAIRAIEVVPSPTVATVRELQQGDRACYVQLEDAAGTTTAQLANFDICDQDILGQQVELTYELGNILAFSCQGDIDCGRTNTVRLISNAEVTDLPVIQPPQTTEPPQPSLVSDLRDGNYRFWSGTTDNAIVSNEDLLADGGNLLLFSKQGNNITGTYGQIDNESLCIQGQINENTFTGISVQTLRGATVRSADENFAFFDNAQTIRVRRGRQISPEIVRYDSTIIDLSGLSQINAGTRLPPERC